MASSGHGLAPLLGGSRFARAAFPGPTLGDRSLRLDDIVADYLFGAAEVAAPAELQSNRLPDADGGFRWSMQWRTDFRRAWSGKEQRAATLARSRDRFEGSFFLNDTDARYVRQLLSATPTTAVELPLPHEAVAAISAITDHRIVVDTDFVDWAAIGRRVYILGPAGGAYSATITGVNGDTLNLDASPPVGGSFPAALTMVYPLESVSLDEGQTLSRYPVNASRWPFSARAGTFRALVGTGATLTEHDDLPVLHRRPRYSGTAGEQILGGVEFVDHGGAFASGTSWDRSAHRRTLEWTWRTPAERQYWKLLLAYCRGRLKPFLCPTWMPDIVDYGAPAAVEDWLDVEVTDDMNYITDWWPSLAHRRLWVVYVTGVTAAFTVDSVTDFTTYHRLTLDSAFTGDDIASVSFLETVRLDSDEIAIEYGEGWRGRIQLPIVTVQDGV